MGRKRRGLSLMELVVAIAVLGCLTVLLIGAIPATLIGMRSACQRAVAVGLLENRLVTWRLTGPEAVADDVVQVLEDDTRYTVRTRRLGPLPGPGTPPTPLDETVAVQAEVRVEWLDKHGRQEIGVQTVVGRYND